MSTPKGTFLNKHVSDNRQQCELYYVRVIRIMYILQLWLL